MAQVYIYSVDGQNLAETIEAIFASVNLEMRGKTVLVKPNMLGPYKPDSGVITHPAVLSAVVKSCLARGAAVKVGDNPGGVKKGTVEVGRVTGLAEASHGCFVPINERVEEIALESEFADRVLISSLVREVDLVINVPVCKTHILTGLTGAIKNTYGYVAGAYKSKLHLQAPTRRRMATLICDLFALRPPDLNIVDALTVMEGNGPSHGRLRDYGKIIAGTDAVAVDATLARIMGLDPAGLHMLRIAAERGYGTLGEEEIEYIGELPAAIPGFQVPITYLPEEQAKQELAKLPGRELPGTQAIIYRSTLTPGLTRPDICDRCGDCAANCPPRVIELNPYPEIGRGCISCFCCVELCPNGALEVDLPDNMVS
jgi:uncharacterized protein (DUF362 family)/NAD-dependent dihydropyrimidine dehydrogenase PreA subunit